MPTPQPSQAPVSAPTPSPSPSPTALPAGGGPNGASSNGVAAASSNAGTPTTTIIIIVVVAVVLLAAAAAFTYYLRLGKKDQHPSLSFSEQYGVRPSQRDSFQGASPVYQQHQQPRRSSVSVSASSSASAQSQRHAQGDARKSLRLSMTDLQPRSPSRPSIAIDGRRIVTSGLTAAAP